jgi:hypothetical protein
MPKHPIENPRTNSNAAEYAFVSLSLEEGAKITMLRSIIPSQNEIFAWQRNGVVDCLFMIFAISVFH